MSRERLHESTRIIREHQPTRLSTIDRVFRGDIETIVSKALEKDRDRRYQSSVALGQDIRRYLEGEAIVARPPSFAYQVRVFARRKKLVFAVLAAVLVASLALVLSGVLWRQAAKERKHRIAVQAERLSAEAEARVQEGIRLAGDKDYEGAQDSYEHALNLVPDHFKALANFARLKKDLFLGQPWGHADLALLSDSNDLLDRALETSPDHAGLWNVKAVVLYLLGRLDAAEEACRRSLDRKPQYYWAASNLAKVLAMQGRVHEALESALDATARAGNKPGDTWAAGPWVVLGTIELHLGRVGAVRSLTNASACDESRPGAWLIRARLRLQLDGYIDIRLALRAALNADDFAHAPDPRAKRMLALAYLRDGAILKAIDHAQAAIELGGMAAINHLIIAVAEAQRSHYDASHSRLRAAASSWPAELQEASTVIVSAKKEVLWFDTAEELIRLRDEAQNLIDMSSQ